MFADNFEYDNKQLSDYGFSVVSFNGSNNDTVSSGADITFKQVKAANSNIFNLYSSTYEEVFTAKIQIAKDPRKIKSQNELHLSPIEVSKLQRWLCQKRYCKFKIDQDGYEKIYWNATFSSKQILVNGRILGLELSLCSDAPFGYYDEISIGFECKKNIPFKLYDLSDEVGFIRPKVEITMIESGDFELKNSLDDNIMKISNVSTNEVIEIDGKNQLVFSSIESHDIAKDFNFMYPKIINNYDTNLNIFTTNLDAEIIFKYSPIIKVGL